MIYALFSFGKAHDFAILYASAKYYNGTHVDNRTLHLQRKIYQFD